MRLIGEDKFNGSPARDTKIALSGALIDIMLQDDHSDYADFMDIMKISTGCLIVLDGIDGCGKSTLAKYLAEMISSALGERVILTQEPAYVYRTIDFLEVITKGHQSAQALRFILDHAVHLKDVIVPALMLNRVVICDRWTPYSSTIYQGTEYVKELVNLGYHSPGWSLEPDLSLIMTVDIEKAWQRLQSRGSSQLAEYEKFQALGPRQEGYLTLLDEVIGESGYRIDGNLLIENIGPLAFDICMSRIEGKRGH